MSSSSPRRLNARASPLAALAPVAVISWAGAAQAAGPQLDVVAVLPSAADGEVTVIADVRPPSADRILADQLSVTTGGRELPARVQPVMSDRPSIGIVVDPPAPGAPEPPTVASGAANFLLQMPLAAQTVVVADTTPPKVIAPLGTGAAAALQALSAVEPGGPQDTSNALNLVIGQLPSAVDELRVVLLHTEAPNAGRVPASELGERLRNAHVVLGVVTSSSSTAYWSQVTAASGGLVKTARPAAPMAAFDDVAEALRSRYVVTFAQPRELPARVSVRVRTPGGAMAADAVVPAGSGAPAAKAASRQQTGTNPAGGSESIWPALGGGAVLVASALLILQRRRASTLSPDRHGSASPPASPPASAETSQPQSEAPADPRAVDLPAILQQTTGPGRAGHPVSATAAAIARQRAGSGQAAARAIAGREAGEAAVSSGVVLRPITAAAVDVARQRARAGQAAARAVAGREAGEVAAAEMQTRRRGTTTGRL